jgi:nucleoside-diphosphate-sugar epimerase
MTETMENNGASFGEFAISDLDDAVSRALPALSAIDGGSLFLTGGTGFFGRWLLAVLARSIDTQKINLLVTTLTRNAARFAITSPELANHASFRFVEGDVRYFEFPKGRFTHVIHAATDTSADADLSPLGLIDTITAGTQRVLEFAAATGIERVLLTSSGAIYGTQPPELDAFPEDYAGACSSTDRRSSYGQAKRLAEQLATVYFSEYGLKTVITRPFAFVGPGMPLNGHFAIGNFIRDATRGEKIIVSGDGTPLRSYLYAADLAAWLMRLLVQGQPGTAYNVGSDHVVSIAELAAIVSQVVPGANGYEIRGTAKASAFRSGYVPSVERARQELGLEVWTSLEDAIAKTARWARRPAVSLLASDIRHRNEHANPNQSRVLVVDVDGVVAGLVPDNDYRKAEPLTGNIAHINRLHDAGYRIVMFTARGSATGIDWSDVTRNQFSAWGLKYHELRFGKPAGDYYIDDRLLSINQMGKLAELVEAGPADHRRP